MHNSDSTDGTDSVPIKTNEVELDTQPFKEQNVFLFSRAFGSYHTAMKSVSQHIRCTRDCNRGNLSWTPEKARSKQWNKQI